MEKAWTDTPTSAQYPWQSPSYFALLLEKIGIKSCTIAWYAFIFMSLYIMHLYLQLPASVYPDWVNRTSTYPKRFFIDLSICAPHPVCAPLQNSDVDPITQYLRNMPVYRSAPLLDDVIFHKFMILFYVQHKTTVLPKALNRAQRSILRSFQGV